MFVNIYYSKKKRLTKMPTICTGLQVSRKKLEKDFSILEETEDKITAVFGPLLLVFTPQKNNLYKVISVN